MAQGTRLDRLVSIREREEDDARASLARAQRAVAAAHERLRAREAEARRDGRKAEDAALWALDDGARRRALQAVRAAESAVAEATRAQESARGAWTRAHQDTEVTRRIADRRRAEARAEADRKERKGADELAVLRHGR